MMTDQIMQGADDNIPGLFASGLSFQDLVKSIPTAVIVLDKTMRILFINTAVEELFGYAAADVVGGRLDIFLPSQYVAGHQAHVDGFLQEENGQRQMGKNRIVYGKHRDGQLLPLDIAISKYQHQGQEYIFCVPRDNSETIVFEQALMESHHRYFGMVDGRQILVLRVDRAGLVLFASPACIELFGKSEDELIGTSFLPMVHPQDLEATLRAMQSLKRPPHHLTFEHRMQTVKGLRTIVWEAKLIQEPLRDFYEIQAVGVDVSEYKQAQDESRNIKERFSDLTNNSQDVFWIADPASGKNIYISPAFEKIAGLPYQTVEQLPNGFFDIVLPEDIHHILQAHEQELRGQTSEAQYRIRHADGSIRWLRDKGAPVLDEAGRVIRVVGVITDITQIMNTTLHLQESESRFRQFAELIQEVIWIYDLEKEKIIYISPAYETIWMSSCESLYQNHNQYIEAIIPEDLPSMYAILDKQNLGENTELEYRIRRPDGSLRWIWDRSFPIFDEAGKHIRQAGIATDITELKTTQHELEKTNIDLEHRVYERTQALSESEAIYRALFEKSSDGISVYSTSGKLMWINQRALDLIGYTAEEFHAMYRIEKNPLVMDAEQHEESNRFFEAALRGEAIPRYERKITTKNNHNIIVEVNLTAIHDEQQNVKLIQSVIHDITERKKMEHLREIEKNLAIIIAQKINLKEALPLCLELILQGSGLDSGGVYLLDQEKKELKLEVHKGLSKAFVERSKTFDLHSPQYKVVMQGKPLYLPYPQLPTNKNEAAMSEGLHISVIIPIWFNDEVIACVNAASHTMDDLPQYLRSAIENLSSQVGSIIARFQMQEKLTKSWEELSDLFSSFMDFIFVVDENGSIVQVNQIVLDRLGYSWQELSGVNILQLHPAEQRGQALKIFNDVIDGLKDRHSLDLQRKDGSIIPTETKVVWGNWGPRKVLIGVARDMTERKKTEEALRESRDRLKAANLELKKASQMKDEFLASMSHELRTPLTGILGLADALQLDMVGELSQQQKKAIRNIHISGQHLLELINDILDLSKIEADSLKMQFETCSAMAICQASLQLIKGMAHKKNQNVSFSIEADSISLRADMRRMKQVLVNLLSNAIKFTPENGQLGLEVCTNKVEQTVLFTVWDKGIGINIEDIDKIFKPFVQIDSRLERQYSGTGLGLSLVRRMVGLQGGRITVESVPAEGSRFTISMPLSTEAIEALQVGDRSDSRFHGNALVFESNPQDAEGLTQNLVQFNITMTIETAFEGAVEKAASMRPDIIFLDMNFTDGPALDLLIKLKTDKRVGEIPIIATSDDDWRSETMQLGAAGFLQKPYKKESLRIELEKTNIAIYGGMLNEKDAPASLVMIAEDNELILETYGDFLEKRNFRVIKARSGIELLQSIPYHRPDVILVDIQMPGMNGIDVIRKLRAHDDPLVSSALIIALTALAMSGDREKCLAAGADDYLSKPIGLDHLADHILHKLKIKGNPRIQDSGVKQ